MKRILRDGDKAPRQERWSFDASPPGGSPQADDRRARQQQDDRVIPKAHPQPAPLPPSHPAPRPVKSGESPWRKIQIPQEDRRRAAAAGLYRYVGKPPANVYDAQADVRRSAARDAARDEPRPTMAREEAPPVLPPEPPRQAARFAAIERAPAQTADRRTDDGDAPQRPAADAALTQSAMPRPAYARAPDSFPPRAAQGSGNPHLGLTVGAIVGISLAVAAGLSWIAAPALDRGAALRADILQLISPLTQTAEQPITATPPSPSHRSIEVAPEPSAAVARTAPVQPIEVAP